MEIKNRQAYFNYFVEEEYEAGIALMGTEIKSIRASMASIKDSYIRIKNNEAYIINMYIAKYESASIFNHDEYRERKLLLHKTEIKKMAEKVKLDGLTLVPLAIYIKNGKAKVKVGLCKGKKTYDKRNTIKERDILRSEKIY